MEDGFDGYGVTAIEGTLSLRYRFSMPGANGKTTYTDMPPDEFLEKFNIFANPEQASPLARCEKRQERGQFPGIAKKDEDNDASTLSYRDAHKIETETSLLPIILCTFRNPKITEYISFCFRLSFSHSTLRVFMCTHYTSRSSENVCSRFCVQRFFCAGLLLCWMR